MRRPIAVVVAVALLGAGAAFAYDMGDLPQFRQGDQITGYVPPEGAVPETDQWPAAAWFEHNGVQFVIYAKHLAGYDPASEKGRFEIWVSVPRQHRAEIEAEREYTNADAYAYLQSAGLTRVTTHLVPTGVEGGAAVADPG